MACTINFTSVNGIVQVGQLNPSKVRILGTALDCPGGQIRLSSNTISVQQTANIDANGRFRAELIIPAGLSVQCGQLFDLSAECIGSPHCHINISRTLECCQIKQLFFQAVASVDTLTPSAIQVSGVLLGCASDTVIISSSVTATVTKAVNPMTGEFTIQIPTTTTVKCDEKIWVTASCGNDPGCYKLIEGNLLCAPCYRASVAVDTSSTCHGNPLVKPIIFTSSIAIAAGSAHDFYWDFGDSNVSPPFSINNNSGTAATVHVHTLAHDYLPGTYTATLKINPPPFECEELKVPIVAQCVSANCPTVTVDPPQVSQNCVNNKKTVTLTSNVSVPSGSNVFAQWDFGDGSFGQGIIANAGQLTRTSETHEYVPGTYTASFKIISPTNCSSYPVTVVVTPCATPPCTVAVQGIAVQIGPCNPMTGKRTVTATASVNNADPALDVYHWQWDANPSQVGFLTESHEYAAPGTGQTDYTITFTVTRGTMCLVSFSIPIKIDGCSAPCPQITDIAVTPLNCASASSTLRPVDLTAQISNAGGSVYEWDFGDGSPIAISPTATAPRHDYATSPGSYVAKVTAKTPGCPDSTFAKSFTISSCNTSEGQVSISCAILLWIAVFSFGIGALLAIIGCLLTVFSNWPFTPGPFNAPLFKIGVMLGVTGVVLAVIGAILFLTWWVVCRLITACSVLKAVYDVMIALKYIFLLITAMIGLLALILGSIGLPFISVVLSLLGCIGSAFVTSYLWGVAIDIIAKIAQARSCLNWVKENSSSASSSQSLTGIQTMSNLYMKGIVKKSEMSTVGLGDVVSSMTSAIGIKPCGGCMKRAEALNRQFPLGIR